MAQNPKKELSLIEDPIGGEIRPILDPRKADVGVDTKAESLAVIPTIPDLIQMAVTEKWVEFILEGKLYKVKIKSLPYGQIMDIAEAGKNNVKEYRSMLVLAGMIDPQPTNLDHIKAMGYGFVQTVSKHIERLSKATATYQKKF